MDGHVVSKDNGYITSKNGNRTQKWMTSGWELLVEWCNGSSDWVPLKNMQDLKDTNPVELDMTNKITEEPAFAWQVKYCLDK
jgi:hypothetical protein